MASTGFTKPGTTPANMKETTFPVDIKTGSGDGEKAPFPINVKADPEVAMPYSLKPAIDTTHRRLKPRHIQLIGIGG